MLDAHSDERDRWGSADAWCSNCTLTGHDGAVQGCPQATASAPLTLAGGRLWGTRVWREIVMTSSPFSSILPQGRGGARNAGCGQGWHRRVSARRDTRANARPAAGW